MPDTTIPAELARLIQDARIEYAGLQESALEMHLIRALVQTMRERDKARKDGADHARLCDAAADEAAAHLSQVEQERDASDAAHAHNKWVYSDPLSRGPPPQLSTDYFQLRNDAAERHRSRQKAERS